MKKFDHAHVEAATLSLLLIVVLLIIDAFVDISDGHPYKLPGYFLIYLICYGILRLIFKRLWRR